MKWIINIGKKKNTNFFWKGMINNKPSITPIKSEALGFDNIDGARAELKNVTGIGSNYRLIMAMVN